MARVSTKRICVAVAAMLLGMQAVQAVHVRTSDNLREMTSDRLIEQQQPQHMMKIGEEKFQAAQDVQTVAQTLTQPDPAGLCSLNQLLAMSVNAVLADAKSDNQQVRLGDQVKLQCKPGSAPVTGPDTFTATCQSAPGDAAAYWSGHLICGKECINSELVSSSGHPINKDGTTPPYGTIDMKCDFWSQPIPVTCSLDGKWSSTQPCKLCDTTDLVNLDSKPRLSVSGLVAPWSKVQLSCPPGMYAFPTAHAIATCQPGGVWHVPRYECQPTGCNTDDFTPGEVDSASRGALGVGSVIAIRSFVRAGDSVGVVYYASACTSEGTWSKPINSRTGTWDAQPQAVPANNISIGKGKSAGATAAA